MSAQPWKSARAAGENSKRTKKQRLLDEAQSCLDKGDLSKALQKLIDAERRNKPRSKK
jgi:hypothetical protein